MSTYKFKQKMKLLNLFMISFCLLGLLLACKAPVEGVQLLPCKEFETALNAAPDAQLVDVRTPEEYAGGTIMAAVNIDYNGEGFKEALDQLDKAKPIFVFCAKGGRSGAASKICKALGFKTIYDLDGGYTAWSQYKAE